MHCIAKAIGKNLNLHMTGLNNGFLKNQLTRTKGTLGFSSRQFDRIGKFGLIMDQTHTATTAASSGFNH